MIQIIFFIILVWLLIDKFGGDKTAGVANGIEKRLNKIKNAQDELAETNRLIQETKNEIARSARKENMEDLQFYTNLLKILIEERNNLNGKSQAKSYAKSFGSFVGSKINDIKNGINDGMKGD